MDYLLDEQGYVNLQSHPRLLVLLDLNLPVIDGYRVLQSMKSDARTKTIPVIILTTTDDIHDIDRCYELGCNIYITKSVEYEPFAEAIVRLGLFFSVVMLPDES